ncbi:MAG: hypothetical protein CK424_02155 [Legionella sp.]|nr:MAG: hypothetical protein CK424_02155 [Legionella sp.]
MITPELIKQIVFPNAQTQAQFLIKAKLFNVPGINFDEKLSYLLSNDDDQKVQNILGPFLRELAVHHLKNSQSPSISLIREEYIKVEGALQFDALKTKRGLRSLQHDFFTQIGSILWKQLIIDDAATYLDPSRATYFFHQKQQFIDKWGADTLNPSHVLPELENDDNEDYGLKNFYYSAERQADIEEISIKLATQQWRRIFYPDDFIESFDSVKDAFVEKWGEATWNRLYHEENQTDSTDSNELSLADYAERKQHFLEKWGASSWDATKKLGSIHPKARDIANRLKQDFIQTLGKHAWLIKLEDQQQEGTFGTYLELEALLDLFDLRCQVTPLTNDIQGTMLTLGNHGNKTIHFYCANNMHWYIHEGDGSATSGYGNNCLYNGFAQWLQLLVQNKTPRKISVPMQPDDKEEIRRAQNRLFPTPTPLDLSDVDDSPDHLTALEIASVESQSIRAMRKEFDMMSDDTSIQELQLFLCRKAELLQKLIDAQHHRFKHLHPLLQKISNTSKEFAQKNDRTSLLIVKELLLFVINTLYLPNTKNVQQDWSKTCYANNIADLKERALQLLPSANHHIKDLANTIHAMEFDIDQRSLRHRHHISTIEQHPQLPVEEESHISSALCLAGLMLMLSGLVSLIMLILMTLISGNFAAVGLLLLTTSIKSLATPLSSILGFTMAHTAVLIASTGSAMMMGTGFTLFKDFAPPHMADLVNIDTWGLALL